MTLSPISCSKYKPVIVQDILHVWCAVLQPYCEPPGACQDQRGDPAQGRATGGDFAGMLQLWLQECLPAGLHPGKGRLCGGAAVSSALCSLQQPQGHELVHKCVALV